MMTCLRLSGMTVKQMNKMIMDSFCNNIVLDMGPTTEAMEEFAKMLQSKRVGVTKINCVDFGFLDYIPEWRSPLIKIALKAIPTSFDREKWEKVKARCNIEISVTLEREDDWVKFLESDLIDHVVSLNIPSITRFYQSSEVRCLIAGQLKVHPGPSFPYLNSLSARDLDLSLVPSTISSLTVTGWSGSVDHLKLLHLNTLFMTPEPVDDLSSSLTLQHSYTGWQGNNRKRNSTLCSLLRN